MATLAEIAQLESKYYPAGASLGAPHRADTIVTTHVDGASYFGAIARSSAPTSCRVRATASTSPPGSSTPRRLLVGGEPTIGERLLTLAASGSTSA